MTENACKSTHFKDRTMQPASLQACKECPFRKANRGREHPDQEPYTDAWLTGIWRSISQRGVSYSCHLFDAGVLHYSDEIKAAGYKEPADIGGSKECAGMVAIVKRELDLVVTSPTLEQYQESRPAGLTKPAISYYLARIRGDIGPEFRMSDYMDMTEILDMHDVVDPNSIEWNYDAAFLNDLSSLVATRECNCIVCIEHHTVHQMEPLHTAEGLDVQVDADLHPLLLALAHAGIRTTASCIDIHEAVTKLAASWMDPLMNSDVPGRMNYQKVLRRQGAFLELRNDSKPERLFLAAAELIDGIEVTADTARSQIVFDRDHIETLTALAVLTAQHLAPKAPKPKPLAPRAVPASSKQDLARKLTAKRKASRNADKEN
jgi:hypothetical protein